MDFFDTYQSLSDFMKALWLIVPPAFLLGAIAILRDWPTRRRTDRDDLGELVYSVYRDEDGLFHIVSHGVRGMIDEPLFLVAGQDGLAQDDGGEEKTLPASWL